MSHEPKGGREDRRPESDDLEGWIADIQPEITAALLSESPTRAAYVIGCFNTKIQELLRVIEGLEADIQGFEEAAAGQILPLESSEELREMVRRFGHDEDEGRCRHCGLPIELWATADEAGDWAMVCSALVSAEVLDWELARRESETVPSVLDDAGAVVRGPWSTEE